jgi:hypothetical protein
MDPDIHNRLRQIAALSAGESGDARRAAAGKALVKIGKARAALGGFLTGANMAKGRRA